MNTMTHRGGTLLLLAALLHSTQPAELPSQPPPSITENPQGAARLRVIWSKKGTGVQGTRVGMSAVGLGDINRDGYDDFSIRVSNQHWIFLGGDPHQTSRCRFWIRRDRVALMIRSLETSGEAGRTISGTFSPRTMR